MKVLIVGSGGREHAIAIKVAESSLLTALYCAPGNPGTAQKGINIEISDTDIEALLSFAKSENIDLTIVGPEAPLAMGITDQFEAEGLKIIGPTQAGAQLESSKEWAKSFMVECGIPTAGYAVFDAYDDAIQYLDQQSYPIVIKADGLAAGKGVTVAQTRSAAEQALKDCLLENRFKSAGRKVVIEQFLKGEEASIFAFTDGETLLPMVSAQDHKRAFDNDQGPNTGGMGAYSPAPVVTRDVEAKVMKEIFQPLIAGFKRNRIQYKGIVYAGLMIENGVPYVVEFNVRFGDPETQVVLPRLKNDLLAIFVAISEGQLSSQTLEWESNASVCVVMASKGYPGDYEKGIEIKGVDTGDWHNACYVVQAGTKQTGRGTLVTAGGRVLSVVGMHTVLAEAIQVAYQGVTNIQFEGQHFRTDIGAKAVQYSSIE